MDYSLGINGGNQVTKGRFKIGYMGALSYKNTTRFYEDAQFNTYQKGDQSDEIELRANRLQVGDYGTNNVLVSALVGGAIKSDRSKIKLNFMHLQNGPNQGRLF